MKKIAILLNCPVKNDYRVIKTITSLSTQYEVHLFYINGSESDKFIFKKNVTLHSFNYNVNFFNKIIRNTFFCFEFNFFKKFVLNSGLKFDAIWSNDLPTLFPAFQIASYQNCKLIYDSHEIFIETINQFFPRKSSFPKSLIFKFLINFMRWHGSRIEGEIVNKVDLFITVNRSLCRYFESKYNLENLKVIMNLPNYDASTKVKTPFNFKQHLNLDEDSFVFLYQGALNEGRGLKLMMEASHFLDKNVKVVVLGNGTLKKSLVEFVHKNHLEEVVKFLDAVPVSELPSYTLGADFGINLLEDFNLSKKLASPNKLFEYMHAEIPVLSSFSPENDLIYNLYEIGLQCENSPENIAIAMNKLANTNSDKLLHFTEELKRAKKEYSWEKQENILINII
jgi:glycosyltransferase involved in cell wall biosynthesis